MRLLVATFLLALALPTAAFATDAPAPAVVAACQTEYAQLGKDAFVAKYGPTEPFGHCYQAKASALTPAPSDPTAVCKAEYVQLGADAFKAKYRATEPFGACLAAHGGTVQQPKPEPQPPVPDDPAVAACKAEYLKLGASAFVAKYGATETLGNCVKGRTQPKPQPKGDGGASSVASALCAALAKSLDKDQFVGKYGPREAMGACVKQALAKAKALVASCRASSGTSKDAFKACIAAGVGAAATKRR